MASALRVVSVLNKNTTGCPSPCTATRANTPHTGGMQTGLADGSVRTLGSGVSLPTYQAACNPADGIPLGPDW